MRQHCPFEGKEEKDTRRSAGGFKQKKQKNRKKKKERKKKKTSAPEDIPVTLLWREALGRRFRPLFYIIILFLRHIKER